MISVKLATLVLFKIMIFRSKGYDVMIPDYDVIGKILLCDSNHFADVVM